MRPSTHFGTAVSQLLRADPARRGGEPRRRALGAGAPQLPLAYVCDGPAHSRGSATRARRTSWSRAPSSCRARHRAAPTMNCWRVAMERSVNAAGLNCAPADLPCAGAGHRRHRRQGRCRQDLGRGESRRRALAQSGRNDHAARRRPGARQCATCCWDCTPRFTLEHVLRASARSRKPFSRPRRACAWCRRPPASRAWQP